MPILLQEERDGVQLLTLNRPEALNALSTELALALLGALDAVRPRRDVRAVIITGAGDRAFCAGADFASGGDWMPTKSGRRAGVYGM